jgi:UDP-glucose 4-epimerase
MRSDAMKILLTGGNGFVGKFLQTKLYNHTLVLTSRGNMLGSSLKYFKKSISSKESFADCLIDVEVVIHAAARVHQMNDLSENPLAEFMETNCLGTLNLARQAANFGVKRFIFLSSIKVNGERTSPNQSFRFDDARKGDDDYAKSKTEAELGLLKIAADTQLEVVIIRPPLVYGPGVKANFAALLNLAARNPPLPLGSVENKRGFVAIDNLASLIVTCIDHPKAANQVFLVSDDSDISTPELFTIMVEAFGKKARLVKISPSFLKGFARLIGKKPMIDRLCDDLRIDIGHTKDSLDWTPIVSTTEGVKLCVPTIITSK